MVGVAASTIEQGIKLFTIKFNHICTAQMKAETVAKRSLE